MTTAAPGSVTLAALHDALAASHLETARRIGIAMLADPATRTPATVLGLHDALAALTDFRAAQDLLATHADLLAHEPFAVALRFAEDAQVLRADTHYRLSEEARLGFTIDEYQARHATISDTRFAEALRLADTAERIAELRAVAARCRRELPPEFAAPVVAPLAPPPSTGARGGVRGLVVMEDGSPAAHAIITLGLEPGIEHADPLTYTSDQPGYRPKIGELRTLKTHTDAAGAFAFPDVPAGVHDFIAVTLDAEKHAIATRFIARRIPVVADGTNDVGRLVAREWRSAASKPAPSPHREKFHAAGTAWRKRAETRLHNPFYYPFRRQLLRLPLPADLDPALESLRVEIVPGQSESFQIIGREVAVFTDLPPRSDRHIAIHSATAAASAVVDSPLRLIRADDVWVIDTGVARYLLAGPGAPETDAPLLAVSGVDGRWRGRGRLMLPPGVDVASRAVELVQEGPLLIEIRTTLHLGNGADYTFAFTAHAGEPLLAVRETSPALAGAAFEFSLAEFSGGRAFLHWTPEKARGSRHWWSLTREDKLVACLPESVPWWIPPQGFGCAFTAEGLAEQDYIGVVSLRRGEWIDREFERIAQGPLDADGSANHELDWPFPEMVGSSISMITAHTTAGGDAYFRFGCFDGERQWGLYVSSLQANEGVLKEMAAVQHAWSSPRLQEFKDWHLDEPDIRERPHLVASRAELVGLRAKARSPRFATIWGKIRAGSVPGPAAGLAFAVECDPVIAWRKRLELVRVAEIRARMVLFGRDRGDTYSPVMGRPITPWAEEYDLIAASGVFDEEEERALRAYFILMGHMFMETDFMNWRFNARNANFEADRTDIVGTVGLAFAGHADSAKFLDHVLELTKKSLLVYCTPGSGKWYENPACYYLQAAKCRMNLVFHLSRHGRMRLDDIPRLRDFLRWGIVLLQPPTPVSYAVMRDGGGAEAYARAEKIRKIPPIGDHATLGRWLPEHYATIGKLFRDTDPVFAKELHDAYFAANADGRRLVLREPEPVAQVGEQLFHDAFDGATFGNLPLFFSVMDEADIPPEPPALPLHSRRLEGFGAVLRHRVGADDEGYVLLKQGPGGYRFHRTEGSFLLFANGKPLVYDGGEAGETWRHSTLSFHDAHTPLASGHVERFCTTPEFSFTQGVHPVAVAPGEAVYLSDSCKHELVAEAHRRFRQEPPGVVRSLAWIDGRTLIVHDALAIDPAIPSHWHLQVVGEAPSGNPRDGYHFPGRFGTDLQVLFPGQTFTTQSVSRLPVHEYKGAPADWFSMQHLQVSAPGARDYLAVLHPLGDSDPAIDARALEHDGRIVGVLILSPRRADRIWFGRGRVASSDACHAFDGRSGALLVREDRVTLIVLGAGRLCHGDFALESDGPEASLSIGFGVARLVAEGTGTVRLSLTAGRSRDITVSGSLIRSFDL